MLTQARFLLLTLLTLLTLLQSMPALAMDFSRIDSVSASLGRHNNSSNVDVFSISAQNKWNRGWFDDGAWYVGGFFDLSLTYMTTDKANRRLYDLSLTPVLRLQRDPDISSGVSPFSEIGLGPHLLSNDRFGKRDLGSHFQLGSRFGVGVGFGDRGQYELAYHYHHLSNAGLADSNNGLDLHLLSLGYAFD